MLAWLITLPVRFGIRKKYGIVGNPCYDCLVVTFCETCATCQQFRESKIRGAKPRVRSIEFATAVVEAVVTEPVRITQPQPITQQEQPVQYFQPQQTNRRFEKF